MPARVLSRAIISKADLVSTKSSKLQAVDILFSENGPFGPDRKFPSWKFSDLGSAIPYATSDVLALGIPSLYGELSDRGAVDPITGQSNEKGLVPLFFLGRFSVDPTTDPPGDTPGRSLAEVVAELQAAKDAGTLVADFGGVIGTGDATELQNLSGPVPSSYNALASIIGFSDLDYLLSLGSTPAPANEWGFLAGGIGAWYRYLDIFGSDLGGGVPENKRDRTKIDLASRAGVDFLVPGYPGWPYADPWVEFTNDDGIVFKLTGIFVRGPVLDDHLSGKVNITANAIGTEDVGDGSGNPIVQAHYIEHHLFENHFINRSTGGLWTTASTYPKFDDDTPVVKSSTFVARQNYTIASLGDRGLEGVFYSDTEQRSTADVVADLMEWTESRTGISADGQIMKFGLDETVSTEDWPRIIHEVEVYGDITRESGVDRENVLAGSCDWDPDGGKFRYGPITRTNQPAIEAWKNRRKEGEPHENKLIRQPALLRWVMDRRLARLGRGMTLVDARGPVDWLDYDIGTGILFNSEDGPGDGYVDQAMIILRRRYDVANQSVTLTLWDVQATIYETLYGAGVAMFATDDEGTAPLATDDPDTAPVPLI